MRLLKRLLKDWWEPRRCIWPYKPGWATYNPYKKMILDTGLTLEQATEACKELNCRKDGK